MNVIHVICLTLVIAPSVFAMGWLIFRTWEGFRESLWYEFLPDIISFFRGELKRDWMAEIKLGLFIIASLIVAAYEKKIIDRFFE